MDALKPALHGQIRAEDGNGDLEETHMPPSSESVELKDSSEQSRQRPEKAAEIQDYQHESVKTSEQLQARKTFMVNEKAFKQSKKRRVRQKYTREKMLLCDQCGREFRYPANFSRHQHEHCRQKAVKQTLPPSETHISSFLEPALENVENRFTNCSERFSQNSKVTTDQSSHCRKLHLCDQCGKAFKYVSQLAIHQRVHSRQKAANQRQSPSEMDSPSLTEPTPLAMQMENTFTKIGKGHSQNSKVTTDQSSHCRKLHLCDQCGKAFKYVSQLAIHQRVHSRQKAANQRQSLSEVDSPSLTEPTPLAMQMENTFTKIGKGHSQNSKVTTDQSSHCRKLHLCDQCGKAFKYVSQLAIHQRVHSRQKAANQRQSPSEVDSPSLTEPTPLAMQMENTFTKIGKGHSQNSKVTTDQSSHCRKLHLCDQCGKAFKYVSQLAIHQRVHSRQKAANQRQSPSEVDSPSLTEPTPLAMQMENTFMKIGKGHSQNSKVTTDQSSHCRKLHLCDQCGKAFKYVSQLAIHQRVHSRQKAANQRQSPSEVDSPSLTEPTPLAMQMENTFTNVGKGHSQNSRAVTNQSTHCRKYLCDHCEKAFRYPSGLARHQRLHCRQKVAKHGQSPSEVGSPSLVEPTPFALQLENTFTNSKVTIGQRTPCKKLHFCGQRGKGWWRPSGLAQLQHVHSQRRQRKQGHSQSKADTPSLVLQVENMSTNSSKVFSRNSNIMTDKSAHQSRRYLCDHCEKAFRYPSDLARHQLVHSRQKAANQRQSPSEVDSPSLTEPTPLALQMENTFTNISKGHSQNSKVMTHQSSHCRKLHLCDQCGKVFTCVSLLAQHQRVHSSQKAANQGQSLSEVASPSLVETGPLALQMENTFTNSKETIGRSSHRKKLHFCGQRGKGWWRPSGLAQLRRVHSLWRQRKQSQSQSKTDTSSLVLQGENMYTNSSKEINQNSNIMTDQSSHCRRLYLCDHCGKAFRFPSDLARHQRMHSRQKATKQVQSPSETCSPTLSALHKGSMNSNKILPKSSEVTTVQCILPKKQYICKPCGKCFRWPSDLKRHKVRVHKMFECPAKEDNPDLMASAATPLQAEGTLTGYHKVFSHNSKPMADQSPHKKKPYACSQCKKDFLWPSHLSRHELTHFGRNEAIPRESSSVKCSPSVPIPKLLQSENEPANESEAISPSHSLMTDQNTHTEKPYLCDKCGEGFCWVSELIQHEYTHLQERPYGCVICGLQFRRHVQLVNHHKYHESQDEEKKGKRFQNKHWDNDPGEHMPTELPQNLPPEKIGGLYKMHASPAACECGACDTGTNDRSELLPVNSIWEIGVDGRPHLLSTPWACECGLCESNRDAGGSAEPTEPPLQIEDTSSVTPVSDVSPCEIIPTMSAVPAASPEVPGHVANIHEEETSTASIGNNSVALFPDPNSQDPDWLPSLSSLVQFWKQACSSREGAKPYSCPICSKRFRLAEYLTKHLDIHRPGKSHRCTICNKRFGRHSYLLKHRKKHVVEPAHVCPCCGNCFAQRSYLLKHMRIHAEQSFSQDASHT